MDQTNSNKNWFDVSNQGWKRLNAGRSAAELIREAVSNTFDADDVTKVVVDVGAGYATIEDNSASGISDPALVTTIFMTDKEDCPTKRGRKGRGLKELISAADWASVESTNSLLVFDADGRHTRPTTRTVGTKVHVKVPMWTDSDADATRLYLSRIIAPDNIKFVVNGVEIKQRKTRATYSAYLKTQVVVDGIQKDTYATTNVSVVNLAKGETEGWIYEMGIPIQKIKTKFHINIHQRVPLNDNRDTVDSWFLGEVYGLLVNKMIDNLSMGALKQEWAQQGLRYVYDSDVKKKIVSKVFGNTTRLAVKSNNRKANDVAQQHGYKLVDVAALPSGMEDIIVSNIPQSESVATRISQEVQDEYVDNSVIDPTGKFAAVMKYLGRHLLGYAVNTEFFKRKEDFTGYKKAAHFRQGDHTIGFNVESSVSLTNPLDSRILSLVVHEFAHNSFTEHDDDFHAEVQRLGGALGALLLDKGNEVMALAGRSNLNSDSKKLIINCMDCGAPREIYPQDVHQVKRCVTCTKRARRMRAKARK